MLNMLLTQVDQIFLEDNQPHLAMLYKTIFAKAYYGMLRIGEVSKGDHPILAKDVHIGMNKRKILLILHTSKTDWLYS